MRGKINKKTKLILLIIIPIIIIILSALIYFLFTTWLPITNEEIEISDLPDITEHNPVTTKTPPIPITSTTTQPPEEATATPTPPTNTTSTTPTPTSTPSPEPLPSNNVVPSVTYEPPPPSPSSTIDPDENYGFNLSTIIEFENEHIKDGIKDTLVAMGHPRYENITIADLLKLESLIIVPRDVEFDESELNCCRDSLGVLTVIKNDYPWSLEFLMYAKNLKSIYCFNNQISKINGISNLEKLVYVGFPECNINSLTFIKNLTLLNGVNFNFNQITTFTPLKDLEHLRSIRLVGNLIFNVNPFKDTDFAEINDIWLWGNNITDISPISYVKNLQWLAIGDNDIDDLTPLLSLDNLKELYIDEEQSEEHIEILNELKNRGCNIVIF